MNAVWLFLAVPWACPHVAIVVFSDNTHLLFYIYIDIITLTCQNSYKERFTFLNRDVAFTLRD